MNKRKNLTGRLQIVTEGYKGNKKSDGGWLPKGSIKWGLNLIQVVWNAS